MNNEIKAALTVMHNGVTIEYLEEDAKFRFELRGRERKVDTLTQAKAAIDKPEPVKKSAKQFQRVQVLHAGGYGFGGYSKKNRIVVTITSIAEDQYNRDKSNPSTAWTVSATGERNKLGVHSLYLINSANDAKWAEFDDLSATVDRLEAKRNKLLKSIETVKLNDYLTDEESVPTR
jgi:hypothetical protein